jgi:uncharacterized protein
MIKKSQNLKKSMIAAIVTYFFILGFLFVFQRKLQYLPSGSIKETSYYNLEGFSEKKLTTKDAVEVFSWFKLPKNNQKIILYFHGNAGNIGDRAHKLKIFSDDGFGILAISYRGYNKSAGTSSEEGLMLDAEAALDFLISQGFEKKDIILFGESLGSGVAVKLAKKYDGFSMLFLESPYSSILSVAQKQYWFVPVSLLLKDKFESEKFIKDISSPVLIIHGTKDRVVAYEEGKNLFEEANFPKKFISIKGADHLDFSEEFLLQEMKIFLEENYK